MQKNVILTGFLLLNLSLDLGINLICCLKVNAQSESLTNLSDLPEEVLRAEIYTEARSPVDGKFLTAREYVELQEELSKLDGATAAFLVSPRLRELIDLLKLRRTLRQIIPFIP